MDLNAHTVSQPVTEATLISCAVNEITGNVASVVSTDPSRDDVMMISDNGIVIRTHVEGISTYSRAAKGVRMMRLDEGASIVNFTLVEREDDENEEQESEIETTAEIPQTNQQ